MSGPGATFYSILMIVAALLATGGIWMIAQRRAATRGMLMLVAAAVMIGNVLVWTL